MKPIFLARLAALVLLLAPASAAAEKLEISPRLPTDDDPLTLRVSGQTVDLDCPPLFDPPVIEGNRIRVPGTIPLTFAPCDPQEWSYSFPLGPLAAGDYRVEATIEGEPYATLDFTVEPASGELRLQGGRLRAVARFQGPAGEGVAAARGLGTESGYFTFFSATNVELTLKILDGRPVNGHYWVFVASMTTLDYELEVMDVGDGTCLLLPVVPPACPRRVYRGAPGRNVNHVDLGFPAAPPP
jgi:hypothetical protein